MDSTFLQLVSLIVSLSNQVRDLQTQNAELLAAAQKASQDGLAGYVPLLKPVEAERK